MSLKSPYYEIYKNLKYFLEIRGLEFEYHSLVPNKVEKPLTVKDILILLTTQIYFICSCKIKNNTKTYIIIYANAKDSKIFSNDIESAANKIPEIKSLKRTYNIDIHFIIFKKDSDKNNIIKKINSLQRTEHPCITTTYHNNDLFLIGDITKSNLYVPERKLNDTEKEELLKHIGFNKLHVIKQQDPLVKYKGYNKGDIIEIEFPNIEMGIEIQYRIVK